MQRLAEGVCAYGTSAAYVISMLEHLHRYCMTPHDWQNLARACLSPGQYLDWKAIFIEHSAEQAAVNAANGQPAWGQDMLLGQGHFANAQTGYPLQVYDQINQIATRAWKALPNRGQVAGNLTKVIQRPTEPFADFVAQMVEEASRILGDADQAMPLVKQLVFEQCTKECRQAINPYEGKGLEVWMKICRELGGPLTNAGLAAAVMQPSHKQSGGKQGSFKCGQPGHIKWQCPQMQNQERPWPRMPGLCPRCRKGNH